MSKLAENLARLGRAPRAKTGKGFSQERHVERVVKTPELLRVVGLPSASWDPTQYGPAHVMTHTTRTLRGEMTLRPIQAAALLQLHNTRGLFAPIQVGHGKTLVSFLAPLMVGAVRPLLLVPASLLRKTDAEFARLAEHWQESPIVLRSYEWLSRAENAEALANLRPDLIVADECHRLKNPKAAVTNRVRQYMKANPSTVFVAMSGTITSRSLRDFSHILEWTHGKEAMPLPEAWHELSTWARAVDAKVDARALPGALSLLGEGIADPADVEGARRVVRSRILRTPGVVGSIDGRPSPSLNLYTHHVDKVDAPTAAHFQELETMWTIPTGWGPLELTEPVAKWRAARQIALGFVYHWETKPPKDWMAARRSWGSVCREVIRLGARKGVDSELLATNSVERGEWDHLTLATRLPSEALAEWRAVRDTYTPVTVPKWFSDDTLDATIRLVRDVGACLVWVEQRAFAGRLHELTGWPLYQEMGLHRGRSIEAHKPEEGPAIVSIASNSEGRNLQAWSRNVIVGGPANGKTWEQLLGRTHREGQESDEVDNHLLTTCSEDIGALLQATEDARYIASGMQEQKLLYCTRAEAPPPNSVRYLRA